MLGNNLDRLFCYLNAGQLVAAYELFKNLIQLLKEAECKCPFVGKVHKVEVLYWPRTAYHWEGRGPDPNGAQALCKIAAEESKAYWDERWAEYYSMVL